MLSFTPTDEGNFTIRLITRDGDGGVSTTEKNFSALNAPPIVNVADLIIDDPTGPPVVEGDRVTLSGVFSDAGLTDTHTVEINWGDGSVTQSQSPSAAEPFKFTFSHTYDDDYPTLTPQDDFNVTVKVIDSDGGVGQAVKVITVNNVAPKVLIIDDGSTGSLIRVRAVATDVPTDPLTYSWTVNNAVPAGVVTDTNSLELDRSQFSGFVTLEVAVTDDDLQTTTLQTLYVGGSNDADTITITPTNDPNDSPNAVTVSIAITGQSNPVVGDFVPTGSILISGAANNDTIIVDAAVTTPTSIAGGTGNDSITAGSGNDYIDGNEGDDVVVGGAGNDSMVSASGNDTLNGGMGDDSTFVEGFSTKTLVDELGPEGGIDTIDFSGVGASAIADEGVTLDLNLNDATAQNVRSDGVVSLQGTFENVTGTNFRDAFRGNAEANLIYGGDGQDSIYGGSGGEDTLDGGDGNDLIYGGSSGDDSIGNVDDSLLGSDGNDVIYGGGGDDSIYGSDGGDETLIGGDGNDVIYGGSNGNDSVDGGAGNDLIVGSDGNDVIYGGEGDDSIIGGNGGDETLVGGDGNDIIYGGDSGDDSVDGGSGDDTIIGGDGNDVIYGGEGDDSIVGGSGGNETLIGGDGNDMIYGGNAGNDSVDGGDGDDTIIGGDGNDVIYGGDGNDSIVGGSGDGETLVGGNGNDVIYGGSGTNDSVDGGFGDDTIIGGDGNDIIYGGDGDDSIVGSAGGSDETLIGGDGNDVIYGGGSGDDSVDGGFGDDTIVGGDGNDIIYGGQGDDSIVGGNGGVDGESGDTLIGGDGNDIIYGGGIGDDSVDGGIGDDTIIGGDGNDIIYGGSGDDSILGGEGPGDETLIGGDGNDIIYGGQNGDDSIDGGIGDDTIIGGDGNDIIYGGEGDDSIVGGDGQGDETLIGGDGNDIIYGGQNSDDSIDGGVGDDTIIGGDGNDIIYGGEGDDSIVGGDGQGDETLIGGDGNDIIYGGGNSDDSIEGGLGDDTIIGGDGNDVIYGGAGDDSVVGGNGGADGEDGDTLIGGDGNDIIYGGGSGDDSIEGGEGDDTLVGADGNDVIYGGDGDDSIVGGDGDETLVGGDGNDVIYGGTNDQIWGGIGSDTFRVTGGNATLFGNDELGGDSDRDLLIVESANRVVLTDSTLQIDGLPTIALIDIDEARLAGDDDNNSIDASGFSGEAVLLGGNGDDTLLGGTGNDTLLGGSGDDLLSGGTGDDLFSFNASDLGNKTITEFAGGGIDTLDFTLLAAGVTVDLADPATQTVAGGLAITLVTPDQFENVFGTSFNDTIRGNASDNQIFGFGGRDLLEGRAGNDTLQSGFSRTVILDFESNTDPEERAYTLTEQQLILARIKADYAAYDVNVFIQSEVDAATLARPHITVAFNAGTGTAGNVVVLGRSERLGWRELAGGGTVSVNINAFVGPNGNRFKDTEDNVVSFSTTIASHELAHMYGLRHHDSFGSVGSGVFAGLKDNSLPSFPGPATANETSQHLIASPNSVGTTLIDSFADLFFGQRESLKLAFAESGQTIAENDSAKVDLFVQGVMQSVQPLGELAAIAVPRNDGSGGLTRAAAVNVVGQIELVAPGGISESDYYSFTSAGNELVTIELLSQSIDHRIANVVDTVVRVYGPSGDLINYYNNPYGAFNDNGFEGIDALLVDLPLLDPGTYTIEVDSFSFDLPEVPEYLPHLFNAAGEPTVCPAGSTAVFCSDKDTGGYEMLVYRVDLASGGQVVDGDTLIGGSGADKMFGNSGNETLFGFNPAAGDEFSDSSGTATEAGGAPVIVAVQDQTTTEGQEVNVTINGNDPDGGTLEWSLEAVPDQPLPFPTGAQIDATGPTVNFNFAPDDDGDFEVRVVVTDSSGASSFVDFTITVIDPTAIDSITSSATLDQKVLPWDNVVVSGTFSDLSVNASLLAVWDDGSSSPVTISPSELSFTASHVYQTGGIFAVKIVDADDPATVFAETSSVVTGVRVTADNVLQVVGTDQKDKIRISEIGSSSDPDLRVEAKFGTAASDGGSGGGSDTYHFDHATMIQSIYIVARDGDDDVSLGGSDGGVDVDATIFGGAGNDKLRGGRGNDAIYGESGKDKIDGGRGDDILVGGLDDDDLDGGKGNDVIIGGDGKDKIRGDDGRDVLVGGDGKDDLKGGDGDDLLIAGTTAYDDYIDSLQLIMAEWGSNREYQQRIDNIRAGEGPVLLDKGVHFDNSGANPTVWDDDDKDKLKGEDGKDWYFAELDNTKDDDKVKTLGSEIVDEVDDLL